MPALGSTAADFELASCSDQLAEQICQHIYLLVQFTVSGCSRYIVSRCKGHEPPFVQTYFAPMQSI